ncbi:MAG: hypothetical protein ABFC91_07580 [Methanobacteriaceae archaeon]
MLNKNVTFPLVTVKLKDADFTVFQLSDQLRQKGWIVPAYTLPENVEDIAVIRMVIKENFGRDLVEILLKDIFDACHTLEQAQEEKERKNLSLLY